MSFGVEAQGDFVAIWVVGAFAALRAEGEIVIDTLAEGGLNFGETFALEGDHIAQAYDLTEESPVIGFNRSGVTLVFRRDLKLFPVVARWERNAIDRDRSSRPKTSPTDCAALRLAASEINL